MQVGGENWVLKAPKAAGCQKHEPTPEPEMQVGMSEPLLLSVSKLCSFKRLPMALYLHFTKYHLLSNAKKCLQAFRVSSHMVLKCDGQLTRNFPVTPLICPCFPSITTKLPTIQGVYFMLKI